MTKQAEINVLINKLNEELVIVKKELSNASCKYKKIQSQLNKGYKDLFHLGPELMNSPAQSIKK